MIRGIEQIQKYLGEFTESYAIIGGTACDILMNSAGLDFRGTKDVDMIVIAEASSPAFVEKLQEMIRDGGYQRGWTKVDQVFYFRFDKPTNSAFPNMVELFSRGNALSDLAKDCSYIRLEYSTDYSPLSAILMDDNYYEFACQGVVTSNGISILSEDHLIPLKIRAWIDLSAKKAEGVIVNSEDILKHKRDVFRLCQLVIPNKIVPVSSVIYGDIQEFLASLKDSDEIHRINGMGLQLGFEEIVELLNRKYQLI